MSGDYQFIHDFNHPLRSKAMAWMLHYLPHKRPEIYPENDLYSDPLLVWYDDHYILRIQVVRITVTASIGWLQNGSLETRAGFTVRECMMDENSDILECLGRQAYSMIYDVDVYSEAFRKHEQALCREIEEKVQEEFPWYNMYVSPGGDDPSALFVNVFNVDDQLEKDRIEEYVHALSDEYITELGGGFMIGAMIRDSETTRKYYPEYYQGPKSVGEAWQTIQEELVDVLEEPHIRKAKNMVEDHLGFNNEREQHR